MIFAGIQISLSSSSFKVPKELFGVIPSKFSFQLSLSSETLLEVFLPILLNGSEPVNGVRTLRGSKEYAEENIQVFYIWLTLTEFYVESDFHNIKGSSLNFFKNRL